ncbi:uncharacterized protein Z518_00363 [Rhinocladiella mackenziei CBS 650.93]|uniref:Uncharacterized protein n=1 Tax=Rhinocladiella mackenziei CBS 650.93 TaxID=1442369 RepID=A0A0D2ITA2_9EURO|nr:uncharacterized protein Z518_00363 [Rhinocladiella mackenziei CBS 650.93]KIX09284.1 hypothetical protein Z518_00363 [Rhinocladiella mackenziei CBS 650.93]
MGAPSADPAYRNSPGIVQGQGDHLLVCHAIRYDERDFTIVERDEKESSQKYHLENPYWKTFDPGVVPLLKGNKWN